MAWEFILFWFPLLSVAILLHLGKLDRIANELKRIADAMKAEE